MVCTFTDLKCLSISKTLFFFLNFFVKLNNDWDQFFFKWDRFKFSKITIFQKFRTFVSISFKNIFDTCFMWLLVTLSIKFYPLIKRCKRITIFIFINIFYINKLKIWPDHLWHVIKLYKASTETHFVLFVILFAAKIIFRVSLKKYKKIIYIK